MFFAAQYIFTEQSPYAIEDYFVHMGCSSPKLAPCTGYLIANHNYTP